MIIDNIRAKRLRVKLFNGSSGFPETLERKINEWLTTAEGTVTNMEVKAYGQKHGYTLVIITYTAE